MAAYAGKLAQLCKKIDFAMLKTNVCLTQVWGLKCVHYVFADGDNK